MKGRFIGLIALALTLLVFSGPVVAHHGSQGYDFTKRISVKGTVNGHPAIELVYAGPLAAKADALHYWVDAASYQPVRIDLPPYNAGSSIAESWIPKTAANTAQTDKPAVPAGFRQVPPSSAFH